MATFTRFSPDDIVITTEKVFTSTWTNNTNALDPDANHFGSLGNLATSYANATSSTSHHLVCYNGVATNTNSDPQFSIAYGHKAGSGSEFYTSTDVGFAGSRAVYGQYRSLVFGDETRNFSFNGHEPEDIFVLNINRSRYKQSLRPSSLNLVLGSNTVNLTDDSVTKSGSAVFTNVGRQFNIVSGSSGVMSGSQLSQTVSGSYGLFYPDAGFIILNPDALRHSNGSSTEAITALPNRLSNVSISGSHNLLSSSIVAGNKFEIDSEEKISSQFYFIRAKNKEFNYTTNPSFIDANGNLNFTSMVDNPVVYITTIGLYNDANELLATAKLSQPITKDFTKEALIKVKLDY